MTNLQSILANVEARLNDLVTALSL